VLINLANNAVKFTEQGDIVITIKLLELKADMATLKFSVADTGIGLSEDQQSRLFQAFTQADGSITRNFGGTGLGLTICKSLVELMQGRIGITSELGVGSCFFFELPMRLNSKVISVISVDQFKGYKALIVDDNEASRHVLEVYLESFNMQVMSAKTAEQGLDLLETANPPFDLVLMDWHLPGMNGLEATQQIKHSQSLIKIPVVIMITAYGREELMQEAGQADLQGFLIKPINASVLFDSLSEIFHPDTYIPHNPEATHPLQDFSAFECEDGTHALVVEDNRINQQVALGLLEDINLNVTIANHGQEALDILQQQTFDLVFMDLQMPVMDGLHATKLIRSDPRFTDLPIIAMTANAMSGDDQMCLDVGMNDYISKPINPAILYKTVHQWLDPQKRRYRKTTATQDSNDTNTWHLEGIDIVAALGRVAGQKHMLVKMLTSFVEDFAQEDANIRKYLTLGQPTHALRLIHTLKGASGNIGASAIHTTCVELERALSTEPEANCQTLLTEMTHLFEQLIPNLQAFLTEHTPTPQKRASAVNKSTLLSCLTELSELLEQYNTSSMRYFSAHRDTLMSIGNTPLLDQVENHINHYEFSEALTITTQLQHDLQQES